MGTARISRLQIFEEKKKPGRQTETVRVIKNRGIAGDLHCMDESKQISIMTEEACRFLETEEIKGLCFPRFKANLVMEGQMKLEVGDRISIGSAVLQVTGRKGLCFDECRRRQKGMDCLLKESCFYASALEGGEIHTGDLLEKVVTRDSDVRKEEGDADRMKDRKVSDYVWERYTRQMMVPGMGREAQERLKESSVLVVGAGGLGSPVLTALAEAGVGRIGVMDADVIELTNLNRQYLYTPADIGKKKAACAGAWLKRFRPDLEVQVWEERLTQENGPRILTDFDLVICAVDQVKTRLMINRIAAELHKPLIDGAIDGYYGTITAVTGEDDPCLACLNPEGKEPEHVSSSMGTTTMIVGALEAGRAVAYLTGQKRKGSSILSYDGIYGTVEEIPAFRNPECPVCGQTRRTI